MNFISQQQQQQSAFITDPMINSRNTLKSPNGVAQLNIEIEQDIKNVQHDIRYLEKRINDCSPRTINSMNIHKIKPGDIKMQTFHEFKKNLQGGQDEYLGYLFVIKEKLFTVAKERRNMIQRDILAFRGELELDYSNLKFKPVQGSKSISELQHYQTQNCSSFDYLHNKMKKKEERLQKVQLNSLVNIFKNEFAQRQYEDDYKEKMSKVEKKKIQIQKKNLKPVVIRNRQFKEKMNKFKKSQKEKEEDYDEIIEKMNQKMENRLERLQERKLREKELKLQKSQDKFMNSLKSSFSAMDLIKKDELDYCDNIKQQLEIKQDISNLRLIKQKIPQQQKLRIFNEEKKERYLNHKNIIEQLSSQRIQRLGQMYEQAEHAQKIKDRLQKKNLREYKKKIKEKEERFKNAQDINNRRIERKEDKLRDQMERKIYQLEKLQEQRTEDKIKREKMSFEKAQKHLQNYSQTQFDRTLRTESYVEKDLQAWRKMEQLKIEKQNIQTISLENTLKKNTDQLELNQQLLYIKNLNKEQLLKKLKQMDLDEEEFQKYFPKPEEKEEEQI